MDIQLRSEETNEQSPGTSQYVDSENLENARFW